jgi:hypothetical protein
MGMDTGPQTTCACALKLTCQPGSSSGDDRLRPNHPTMDLRRSAQPIRLVAPLHSSEWRGPRSYLVDGLERDPAAVQKQAEHIEPPDHQYDLARARVTVLV